jgi:tRNA U38,U39,U40 pseudouridine synthase TruA
MCQRLQGRHDYSAFWHKEVRRQKLYQQQQPQVEQPAEPSQERRKQQQQQHQDIQFSVEITPPPPAEQQQQPSQQQQQDHVVVLAKFILQAKSFQRSQCRNMVGLVVDICRGHVPESVLDQLFASDDIVDSDPNDDDDNHKHHHHVERMASYISAAPASGLCLDQVWYPEDV